MIKIDLHRDASPFVENVETPGWLAAETTVIGVACRICPAWFRNVTGFWPSFATWTSWIESLIFDQIYSSLNLLDLDYHQRLNK